MRRIAILALPLFLLLFCGPQSCHANEKETGDIEAQIYARLKRDGGFADPALPFIVYVKSVQGKKLRSVEFMRFDSSRKKFEMIGRIEECELRVDRKNRQILVDARELSMKWEGASARVEGKIFRIDMPDDLSFLNKASNLPKKENLPLSAEDRKFLVDGFPTDETPAIYDSKLTLAFGPDCEELNRALRIYLSEFRVVISAGSKETLVDGKIRYEPCSIAQFHQKHDRVQSIIRANAVICEQNNDSIIFECPDG